LFAIMRTSARFHPVTLDPNKLRSDYQSEGDRFLSETTLRTAYDILIAPVEHLLDGIRRVVVVPHGPLHQLPFAALLDANNRCLVDRVGSLSVAPSVTLFLCPSRRTRQSAPERCLAIGYAGSGERLLHHAPVEAEAIACSTGGTAWRGRPGVAAEIQRVAHRYRWLHFACHGHFDRREPMRSWLEVGPDERLTARDILDTLTLQAELVTLSACETGVIEVLRGDEPMGLIRAFLQSGAQAVLVTLWSVEDRPARMLMEEFYRLLLKQEPGFDPAAALQAAQRYLRDCTEADIAAQTAGHPRPNHLDGPDVNMRPYSKPSCWAAYQLVELSRSGSTSI
jgi:CHAT domain-containing protein